MKYVYQKVHSITDIDIDKLIEQGKNNIIIDLDNTIARWCSYHVSDSVKKWIQNALDKRVKVCILSNNHNRKRTVKMARALSVMCARTRFRKPTKRAYSEALNQMKSTVKNTVVVGDQIFADISGAMKMKMSAILVDPINRFEAPPTSFMRLLEMLNGRKIKWQEE